MKRALYFILIISFIFSSSATSQGLLKKVSKSMTDELLGRSNNKSNQPEPASACADAELVMDMGGKLQLDYTELTISISDDGRILAKDLHADNYYIVENGVTAGPFKPGDKRLKGFESVMSHNTYTDSDSDTDTDTKKNSWEGNPYITKSGDKFLITFAGKSYGPYARINNIKVTKSKDKFAAVVVENIVVTADQGDAMDKAMKEAKTDQERIDLAMKYAAEMQQKMMQGGGPNSMLAKLITNIPGATLDPNYGANLNNNMKYDDILVTSMDKIQDLNGKTIHTVTSEQAGADFFISSDNTRTAWYSYGTLSLSDKTTLPELFNPLLMKVDGKIYLAYMYYSPKKNSIMKCKIPF
ncbi:MAG: hypothetical protein A2X05_13040 [Bacteroidetes bacterium GWE2_41_25]|nr:MAG: hypothetical protein A2X03_08945 [Bacteroidetes bacterium GWA2_40_15]OFX94191.1 MAG: hypothetical protein A2X06_16265 [Bacteroidetes bacterium GWC2_40_22]OFY10031.1 MAG: hypothetical protein A2X05_13040 [Bacteroidetes bacterium GWE2_41_25]HAM11460.1 hypothetical protein [Bacteroidales bacterium]HBH85815.1 hypothetical protein [Bacteroidales bacterium]